MNTCPPIEHLTLMIPEFLPMKALIEARKVQSSIQNDLLQKG